MALVLVWLDWLSALVGGASRRAQVKSSGWAAPRVRVEIPASSKKR